MEQYIIKGGNPLVGEVEIAGAKNAALAILAAAIMTDETVTIDNLPDVNDINVLLEAISGIGATVQRINRHTVKINGSTISDLAIEYDYIKKIRASYYLLGALLGKYKRAEVALPGGCNIGSRPIDQHLKGFRALGAEVEIEHGSILAEAERLKGTHLYFDVVSVGATINVMMAAAMAEGNTILENVAKEPHVVDVANFLNSMGANIKGAGTDVIRIKGVSKLNKTSYSIIPDQIEAGTFMFAAAATRGDVTVMNDGSAGLHQALNKDYDLFILDLMLPGVDGFEICKEIRNKKNTPIIMVSAKKDDIDKIRGLGLGADDYMTKPFSPSELVARVKAHLARYERLIGSNAQENKIIEIRGLKIDTTARRVWVNGEEKTFTTKEFDLLAFLASHPNHVYKRQVI